MKLFRLFLLLSIELALFAYYGCNEAPDQIGKNTQPPSDFGIVRVDTFYATAHTSILNPYVYSSSIDRFMIGNAQLDIHGNTLLNKAWGCLKFSGWPDSLRTVTITNAEIKLRPFYNFGSDTTRALSLDVFRAIRSVQNDSLTFDSLDRNGNFYFDNFRINSFTQINPGDTICSIPLNTSVIRDWFISYPDTNQGVVIQPSSTSPNIIKGFYSFHVSDTALQPTLYVSYVDTLGRANTYVLKSGNSKYLGYADPNAFTNLTDSLFHVQDGVSYRGLLSFDNLSLPWPILVHQAIVQITLDSTASSMKYVPFTNNRIYTLSVDSKNQPDGSFYTLNEQFTNSKGQPVYQFNVAGMVSGWIKNTRIKKLAFSGYFESGSFDLFTFYGSGTSSIQRPKIIITYSMQR